ncbi:MAG TPA: alpha/beta-type small acid-soluble spore protein [Clostridia bacterium]|nr:alpha/beta-type small acid-soluble spore protein [Clostridia bacterium]
MANYNQGSPSENQSGAAASHNQAKAALEQFKNEVASSLNVTLKQGYNGDMTTREAGAIGGEMVKRMVAYSIQNMPK